jgi:tetratricopeptide (TPR) repeat protein
MKKLFNLSVLLALSFCAYSQTALDYFNKGLNKGIEKDYKGSMADYTNAIELDPNFAATFYFRGQSKARLDDYRGSRIDYTKAIELDPKYAAAYLSRGLSYIKLAEKNKGCLDLSKAGELGKAEAYDMFKEYCQ